MKETVKRFEELILLISAETLSKDSGYDLLRDDSVLLPFECSLSPAEVSMHVLEIWVAVRLDARCEICKIFQKFSSERFCKCLLNPFENFSMSIAIPSFERTKMATCIFGTFRSTWRPLRRPASPVAKKYQEIDEVCNRLTVCMDSVLCSLNLKTGWVY